MIIRAIARRAVVKLIDGVERVIVDRIAHKIDPKYAMVWFVAMIHLGLGLALSRSLFPPLLPIGIFFGSLSVIVPGIVFSAEKIIKKARTPRSFGDSKIPAKSYWAICDVLEQRGVLNLKKYFREHPEHAASYCRLFYDMYQYELEHGNEIAALLYLRDEDPETTRVKIYTLVKQRGDMPAKQYKQMLDMGDTVSPALLGGAL